MAHTGRSPLAYGRSSRRPSVLQTQLNILLEKLRSTVGVLLWSVLLWFVLLCPPLVCPPLVCPPLSSSGLHLFEGTLHLQTN